MSDSLQRAVMKLRKSTISLNSITDEIADVVQQAEEFLNVICSAGVYASVTVKTSYHPGGPEIYQNLVYDRVGSQFRIAVLDGWEAEPDGDSVKAWAECSRDVKLETAKKLPELILEIAKQIDERVKDAEHTSVNVSQVMSALKAAAEVSDLDILLGGE